ncbi:MAG: hypothetical protein FWH41_05000 [Treponema sp.]|nr:hypothetical protein [Treponema sp.]
MKSSKAAGFLCYVIVIVLSFFSIESINAQETGKKTTLTHDDVIGKLFFGFEVYREPGNAFRVDKIRQLQLNNDGTFYYFKHGIIFNGTWEIASMYPNLRYLFEWTEGASLQRFNMKFDDNKDFIIWFGERVMEKGYEPLLVRFIVID